MAAVAEVLALDELTARAAETRRLRWEAMARGQFPDVMNAEECAYFVRRCVDWLLESDCPRSVPPGKGKGRHRDAVFIKSQVVAWLARYLTYDAEQAPRVRHARRFA